MGDGFQDKELAEDAYSIALSSHGPTACKVSYVPLIESHDVLKLLALLCVRR